MRNRRIILVSSLFAAIGLIGVSAPSSRGTANTARQVAVNTRDTTTAPDTTKGALYAAAPAGSGATVHGVKLAGAPADEPTPSASTPPALDPVTPQGSPRQFTVLAAGDILLHQTLWIQGGEDAAAAGEKGYDFDPIFASAKPDIVGADLAICHMETPYAAPDGPFKGYPVFAVPPQIAKTIHDVGYDTCSTASNHSLDDGLTGIDRELGGLDAAGVKHTGSARSAAEAATIDMLDVKGVKVAQLSYAFGFNGIPLPKDKPWEANLIDVPTILAAAHRAKAEGAEVVIVSLHFGTEYVQEPNDQQLSVAKQLLASPDVDLIVGCHVHVVQPFQEINGKWVSYGMGNQVAHQPFSEPTQDGVMPRFTFTEVSPGHFKVTKAEAIPTFDYMGQDGGPYRLIDLPRALADPKLDPARKALYMASYKRTATEVDKMGAKQDGLVVVGVG